LWDITEVDATPALHGTAAAWLAESQAHADQVAGLDPPGAFAKRHAERG
jgi:hypothetical protein